MHDVVFSLGVKLFGALSVSNCRVRFDCALDVFELLDLDRFTFPPFLPHLLVFMPTVARDMKLPGFLDLTRHD